MKQTIKSVIKLLCFVFSCIYSNKLSKKIKQYKSLLYTFWLSKEFKYFGENSILNYPIDLLGGKYIGIGKKSGIGKRGVVTAWDTYRDNFFTPEIIIGDNVWIGDDCHITAVNKIEIGNNVLMGKKVTIADNAHGKSDFESLAIPPSERLIFSKGPIIIKDNVWIGDKVSIMAGVTIGKGSVIGANSVVTKSVPPNTVVGGIPAKILNR